jgi:predicted PurR-regulated permease PerM
MVLIDGQDNDKRRMDVPIMKYVLATVVILLLLLVIILVRDVLLLSFTAALIAIVLDIPIQWLRSLGLNRSIAAPVVLAGASGIFVLLTVITAPTVIRQANVFVNETLPDSARQIDIWLRLNQDEIEEGLEDIPGVEEGGADEVREGIATRVLSGLGELTALLPSLFSGAASLVVSLLIIVFVTIFLVADPQTYRQGFINLLPERYTERAGAIIDYLDDMMRRWVGTTVVSMIILGVGVWLGLMAFNVQEAALIGLIAGISSFMPNFGPIFAVIPGLAVAITNPETNILAVILVIYGLTFLQNQLLLPLMMSSSTRIPPVLITLGQVILGILFGFLGLLLAVPILIVVTVLVREVYMVQILDKPELSQIDMPQHTVPTGEEAREPA